MPHQKKLCRFLITWFQVSNLSFVGNHDLSENFYGKVLIYYKNAMNIQNENNSNSKRNYFNNSKIDLKQRNWYLSALC